MSATVDRSANLEWRVRLFGAGAILALTGMWADQRWMVNVAIAVLALGFVLRFHRAREAEADADADAEADEERSEPPAQG